LATQSEERFSEASQSLAQMVVAMREMETHSDEISSIIKVIDEIAF